MPIILIYSFECCAKCLCTLCSLQSDLLYSSSSSYWTKCVVAQPMRCLEICDIQTQIHTHTHTDTQTHRHTHKHTHECTHARRIINVLLIILFYLQVRRLPQLPWRFQVAKKPGHFIPSIFVCLFRSQVGQRGPV